MFWEQILSGTERLSSWTLLELIRLWLYLTLTLVTALIDMNPAIYGLVSTIRFEDTINIIDCEEVSNFYKRKNGDIVSYVSKEAINHDCKCIHSQMIRTLILWEIFSSLWNISSTNPTKNNSRPICFSLLPWLTLAYAKLGTTRPWNKFPFLISLYSIHTILVSLSPSHLSLGYMQHPYYSFRVRHEFISLILFLML